jgi:phosphoglycerate dehydrogenase-like enzyme
MTRLLVLHDRPDDFADLLPGDADVRWARCPEEVGPAVAEHDPEVVFSIKHTGFPGSAHLPAVRHPGLRWLHIGGSGHEHFDPLPQGLIVTHCVGVLAPFLAETAMAALLSLCTGLPRYAEQQRQRLWLPRRFQALRGRRVLIVGVGAVGEAFACRAAGFGAELVGVRRSGVPTASVPDMHRPEALDALLPTADVVSLHPRLSERTRGLFDAPRIARMKRGAILLNSSRGAVVDTEALLAALEDGRLGGAWLDVTDPEPLPPDHPLWAAPNTLITPHCADQVADFPRRFAQRFVEHWGRWQRGEEMVGAISRG